MSKHEKSRIVVSSLFAKEQQIELLSDVASEPYFEFIINNELVSANDEIWKYVQHSVRDLRNGGQEVVLEVEVAENAAKGLRVRIFQQVFPNSTLMREKIELLAGEGAASLVLNKKAGKLHFKFPQYSIIRSGDAKVKEIRMASWGEELITIDAAKTYDDRKFDGGNFFNLAQSHMFHPYEVEHVLANSGVTFENTLLTKGPFNIIDQDGFGWFSAYEHASQDSYKGFPHLQSPTQHSTVSATTIDAMQGVEGDIDLGVEDKDFWFLGFSQQSFPDRINISTEILRGGYLDGEIIAPGKPYASVWNASAHFFPPKDEAVKNIMRAYLLHQITEVKASRQPEFYYNTWGMQRELAAKGHDIRGVLTEQRVLEDISRAAKLNVDLFVLDDGWQIAQGVWRVNRERFPNGLGPIRQALENNGMKMGIWISPMGIDSLSERYKNNKQWVILDNAGEPIKAQWGHPAFDFVSDFKDTLVADCKTLIDQGALFFKWDAINTFKSFQAGLAHGSETYTKDELVARYEYLLPIYVTEAMKQLTDYNPNVVIEIDLTEADRCMPGLIVLQQGKYFWMNNGASGYGDYSSHRAKSMRNIPFKFNGIIPLELFTYANYPHNAWSYFKQRYLVNSSLIAGHGFWGNLELLSDQQLSRVGDLVSKSKRVLPYLVDQPTHITGFVSSSPEIYTQINNLKGAGQVIAFSGVAMRYEHRVDVNSRHVLAVLHHAYELKNDSLLLDFEFSIPDDTREAFIYSNEGVDVQIVRSSSWLKDVVFNSRQQLIYQSGAVGEQTILWNRKYGKPQCLSSHKNVFEVIEDDKYYTIVAKIMNPEAEIVIQSAT